MFRLKMIPRWTLALMIAAICLDPAASAELVATKIIALAGRDASTTSIAFSPDGAVIATGHADGAVALWDSATGRERATLRGHSEAVRSVAYSPDGKVLASCSNDKSVKLWDLASGKKLATLKGHEIQATIVVFSPDGKFLASVGLNLRESYRSEIKLWNCAAEKTTLRLNLPDGHRVSSVSFSPDSKTLAYGSAESIKLWDVNESKLIPSPKIHVFGSINSVAFSPDGKMLAYCGGYVNRPAVIKIWDVALDKEHTDLSKQSWGLGNVAFSPSGRILATWTQSYDQEKEVLLWDPTTGKQQATIPAAGVNAAAFSPVGEVLAIVESEPRTQLWRITPPANSAISPQK